MQRFSPAVLGPILVMAVAVVAAGCSPIQGERASLTREQVVVEPVQAKDTATGVAEASNTTESAIPAYLSEEGEPTKFSQAAKQAGIFESLRGLGPYTVLAPTDEAFEKLGSARVKELMDPVNQDRLSRLVSCHIIPGRWTLTELRRMTALPTIGGWYIPVTKSGEDVFLGSVKLSEPSLESESLVIYTVDQVFDPEAMTSP